MCFCPSEVFGVPIYLCLWHVRRCWLKHLVKKVHDASTRADMFRALGNIMNMHGTHSKSVHDKECEAKALVDTFMDTYQYEKDFISYFKDQWLPQIGNPLRVACAHVSQCCFVGLHAQSKIFHFTCFAQECGFVHQGYYLMQIKRLMEALNLTMVS